MKVANATFKVPRERADLRWDHEPWGNRGRRPGWRDGAVGEWRDTESQPLREPPDLRARHEARPAGAQMEAAERSGWDLGLVPLGEGRSATQHQQRRWLAVGQWQRRVERVLKHRKLAFKQWLVLDATAALIATTGESVTQGDVAGYLELDRRMVSRAMIVLDAKGLVSRSGPMSGPSWSIFMSEKGMNLLRDLAADIELVSSPC